MAAALNVVEFPQSSLADIPAKLRDLADSIEAGKYGEPGCCAVAMLADELHVFGFGSDAAADAVICVLQAGALKLLEPIKNHGRE